MTPLRSCLATAVREGIIRYNPAREIDLPNREANGVDQDVKAMTPDELTALLAHIEDRWQPFFRFLAATGLRVSEAIALRWENVQLGSNPHVKVRRAIVRGREYGPKTSYGRRDVPLSADLAGALLGTRGSDSELVFPAVNGAPLERHNVSRRVLKPAAKQTGLDWVGFHTFRHTCASMLFAEGRNAVQVQHWLGHHSASFTLATYVHLLDGTLPEPLKLPDELPDRYQNAPVSSESRASSRKTRALAGVSREPETGLEPVTPCLQDRRSTS